jgi:hypothetical protein
LDTALYIGDHWRNFGVNLGYKTIAYEKININYIIHAISIENKIEPVEKIEVIPNGPFVHVLRYPTKEEDEIAEELEKAEIEESAASSSSGLIKQISPIKRRGRPKKAAQIVERPKKKQVAKYAAFIPISAGYTVS